MKIETNFLSPLILKGIIISEGTFKRSEEDIQDIELKVMVNHDIEQISENEYKITLDLTVSDTDKQLSVFVKGIGIFETEQENQTLIERNTIAIMFPYLRSYVSTLTTQPGMAPIVLPPMNVVAMLNQK